MSRQLGAIPKRVCTEIAIYLAGLIDGEACFFIAKAKKRGMRSGYCYTPQFKLVLTHEETIKWVAEQLGLQYGHQIGNVTKNHKDTYAIRISRPEAVIALIEQILPYMITKKLTAEVMLDYCKSREQLPKNNYHRTYSKTDLGLFSKLRELNRVGIISNITQLV